MKKRIVIVFGGRSSEHEVSINSAKNIFKALDKDAFSAFLIGVSKQGTWYHVPEKAFEKISVMNDADMQESPVVTLISLQGKPYIYNLATSEKISIDCIFPIIHGTNGEDGTLQGYFKILNVPFVGCSVLGSALCMDKEFMKIVLTSAGIPNSKYRVLKSHEKQNFQQLVQDLGLPFFIKPANAGSSVGVHKIKSESDFTAGLKDAFLYDHKIIAEEFIAGREIECSVMGINKNPQAATPGELIVKHEFYSYDAKYLDENGAEIVIPAKISEEKSEEMRELAIKAYHVLNCDGMARCDFFLKPDGGLIINELNTLPGFTKISMYPMMWEARGVKYSELITQLIALAFEKYNYDNQLKMSY